MSRDAEAAYVKIITERVARQMEAEGYAYWSKYNDTWQVKRHPQVQGIVQAVLNEVAAEGAR